MPGEISEAHELVEDIAGGQRAGLLYPAVISSPVISRSGINATKSRTV